MDWGYWLGRKYDILQQNAAADTTRAQAGLLSATAGANLDTVRAGLLPAESRANIGLTGAQTGLAAANAAQAREETKYIGRKALADIFATRAQGGLYASEAAGNNIINRGFRVGDVFQSTGNEFLDATRRRVLGGQDLRRLPPYDRSIGYDPINY